MQLTFLAIGLFGLTHLTRESMQRKNQGFAEAGRTDIFDRDSIAPRPGTGSMLAIVTHTFDQGRFK
jgi:hypothetical protein